MQPNGDLSCTQKRRLDSRKNDPLKQWKLSPMDAKAHELWEEYTVAKDEMFERTSFDFAPWRVVQANNKKVARINIIKHFLSRMEYDGKKDENLIYDRNIVYDYS